MKWILSYSIKSNLIKDEGGSIKTYYSNVIKNVVGFYAPSSNKNKLYIYMCVCIIEINTYIEGRVAFMLPIVFWIHFEKGKRLAH